VIRALALLLSLTGPVTAQTLPLPDSAILVVDETEAAGTYDLPVAPWADGFLPTDQGGGQVTRQVWQIPLGEITTEQLIEPIRGLLAAEGFDLPLDCATESCGGFDFRFAIDVLPPPAMHVDLGDFRFLAARKEGQRIGILISRTSRGAFVQIIRVGPADDDFAVADTAPDPRPAAQPVPQPVATGDLAATLEGEGHAVLADLVFQTGSAQLGDGPFASLQALADYLIANPNRRVALVGHTDAEGSLEANIALSRRRAASVLERLVTDYGVPRQQMEAEGMGYLAPLAPNTTAEGRDRNRRVEVILTSTE
jgi:outer membrane protein OmpA-like peptidoglycan-associated protein